MKTIIYEKDGRHYKAELQNSGRTSHEVLWDSSKDEGEPSQSLLDAVQATKDLEDTAALEIQALAKVKNRMFFGQDLIAGMTLSSEKKGLTFAQRRNLRRNLSDIIAALNTGALDDARDLIDNVDPDGTLIIDEDKGAALASIDAYLAAE